MIYVIVSGCSLILQATDFTPCKTCILTYWRLAHRSLYSDAKMVQPHRRLDCTRRWHYLCACCAHLVQANGVCSSGEMGAMRTALWLPLVSTLDSHKLLRLWTRGRKSARRPDRAPPLTGGLPKADASSHGFRMASSSRAARRLARDLLEIEQSTLSHRISARPLEHNVFEWAVNLLVEEETTATLHLHLRFPETCARPRKQS